MTSNIVFKQEKNVFIADDEGTSLEDVSEKDKGACCLSDAMALRLGNIAIQVQFSIVNVMGYPS